MYSLRFLDQYLIDIAITMAYISNVLFNHDASIKLKLMIDKKLDEISKNPYIFLVHKWKKKHDHEYRKAKVKNYYIFFYVNEDNNEIIVARLIYSKMNLENIKLIK